MRPFEEILAIDSAAAFDCAALELFRFQAERCGVYREYLAEIGVDPAAVRRVDEIPMLPIEFFKWRDVYCGDTEPQIVFTSSNTGQSVASHHMMASTALYEAAFTAAFERFYGNPARWSLYGLLPNYLQREGSSLVYMVDRLIGRCGSGGFYLDDYERLLADMAADPKPKILLGVSYALWDLAERYAPKLRDTIVMETGGMKGRREELPKEEFHRILCEAFGVAGLLRRRRPFPHAGLDARRGARRQRPLLPPAARPAGRRRHHRPGEPFLVRLHSDAGRGARLGRRIVPHRRTYRPQRHPGLQPVGTITVKSV